MKSLHGINIHGFPNLFILGLAQGGNLVANVTHNFSESSTAIAAMVRECVDKGHETLEPTLQAETQWVNSLEVQDRGVLANCTPGYYNNEGKPNPVSVQNGAYGGGPTRFFKVVEAWREEGSMQGLELR